MGSKKKLVLSHEKGANDFQETTDLLIKDLLREHGLPPSFIETNAFREFIRHLNPLATFSLYKHQKHQQVSSVKVGSQLPVAVTKIRQPMPTSLRLDPPCIICLAPIATTKGILLNLNESSKILMAAVLTKSVKIEHATQSICNHPLRMCSSHARPVYDMMVKVMGARTAEEVDRANVEKMMPGLEMYKVLRSIRTTIDNKPIAMTPMGSFKMALKKFYRIYTPKEVRDAVKKEKNRVAHMKTLLHKNPSDLHVRTYLTKQSIAIREGEEMDVLDAIKLRNHPRFVEPNMSQGDPCTSTDDQDLLYDTIMERRKNHRQKRYDIYPVEVRKLMEPIDAQYDKQTAECRTEMKSIRKQKACAIDNAVAPNKRSGEQIGPGAKKRPPPTRYQDLVAQKFKEALEQRVFDDQPNGAGTSNKNKYLTTNLGSSSHHAQNDVTAVEKKPEGFGNLIQDQRFSEKKPEGFGGLMQKQQLREKKPEGLGTLMQQQPVSGKKPQSGELLIPKEEPIENYGDEIYNQLIAVKEEPVGNNYDTNPALNYVTYPGDEEGEEIDMYTYDTPRTVPRSSGKYRQ